MNNDLLSLPTKALLDKIGAGNHKPGSGSAAALNGILSCKLLQTVIELTRDPKRVKTYAFCSIEFNEIKLDIENVISPRLEILFQEDSKQFDKAIQKRKERNKEPNQGIKNRIQTEALHELKKSTEMPIEIAELCIKLAKYSVVVFSKGFKSARGDSGVALSSALAGLTGCLSIISLNLQSFPKSSWTDKINSRTRDLREQYETLNSENIQLMDDLDREAEVKNQFLAEVLDLRKLCFGKNNITNSEIIELARNIQNTLWKYREIIWPKNPSIEPLEILKPDKVLKLLDYAFHLVDTLGVNENNDEIAGIINNKDCTIQISSMYPPEVVNFTSAHELGHALLHDRLELHRDMPLDGSEIKNRPIVEKQADTFAACFLMPDRIIISQFKQIFGMDQIEINEDTSWMLENCSLTEFKRKIGNKRDFSRYIAKCEFYNYQPFKSLSKIFQVSIEAMAIRLEELKLLKY